MKTAKRLALLALAAWLLGAPAALALTGNEILKKAEQAMNAPKDRTATERMKLVDHSGSVRERVMAFYQQGTERRLVVFKAPAEVDGVAFLSLGPERMYLYLPAFRKVRRVASSAKNENFMGTDFSYEDLAETLYTRDYTARLVEERPEHFVLELTPKPGAEVSYSRQIMWVHSQAFVPVRTEFFGRDGTLLKTLVAEEIKRVDGYWFPHRMTMETKKSGHRTVLEMEALRHDSGLKERFFTERNLKKLGR